MKRMSAVLLVLLLLTACAPAVATEPRNEEAVPSDAETAAPAANSSEPEADDEADEGAEADEGDGQAEDEEAENATSSGLESQDVSFESEDGTLLAGRYYPAEAADAPGILLLHWYPGSKDDWVDFIQFVKDHSETEYAFLAIDFRGHGGSRGDKNDRADYIDDARAALAYFRDLPGVDGSRIVLIGASIGSDAAVDACGEGCIGAVSLSPGSFTDTKYDQALLALGDKPVLCVAGKVERSPIPETCQGGLELGLSHFEIHMYEGTAHAMDMFDIADQQPLLNDLLLEWLSAHHS